MAQTLGKAPLQSLIVHAAQKRADLPVVVLGAAATLQEAVDAMQLGAADFIAPPFDGRADLLAPQAAGRRDLERRTPNRSPRRRSSTWG